MLPLVGNYYLTMVVPGYYLLIIHTIAYYGYTIQYELEERGSTDTIIFHSTYLIYKKRSKRRSHDTPIRRNYLKLF